MAKEGSLPAWERMLRYEVDRIASLRHAVVYIEGGYSDSNNPSYAAKILNAADIRRVRGFFTNDTHNNWTISEVRYGEHVSRLTGGSHFIINTAQNGRGPKLNPHPAAGNRGPLQPSGLGRTAAHHTSYVPERRRSWTHTRETAAAAASAHRRDLSGRRAHLARCQRQPTIRPTLPKPALLNSRKPGEAREEHTRTTLVAA